jgi:hypothetical protein
MIPICLSARAQFWHVSRDTKPLSVAGVYCILLPEIMTAPAFRRGLFIDAERTHFD